jgi:hypothetical protein
MKKILLPIYMIFLISSCGSKSDDSSAKQKELELKAKELELKEKELEQKKLKNPQVRMRFLKRVKQVNHKLM